MKTLTINTKLALVRRLDLDEYPVDPLEVYQEILNGKVTEERIFCIGDGETGKPSHYNYVLLDETLLTIDERNINYTISKAHKPEPNKHCVWVITIMSDCKIKFQVPDDTHQEDITLNRYQYYNISNSPFMDFLIDPFTIVCKGVEYKGFMEDTYKSVTKTDFEIESYDRTGLKYDYAEYEY